jgi:hypothetical protein
MSCRYSLAQCLYNDTQGIASSKLVNCIHNATDGFPRQYWMATNISQAEERANISRTCFLRHHYRGVTLAGGFVPLIYSRVIRAYISNTFSACAWRQPNTHVPYDARADSEDLSAQTTAAVQWCRGVTFSFSAQTRHALAASMRHLLPYP